MNGLGMRGGAGKFFPDRSALTKARQLALSTYLYATS